MDVVFAKDVGGEGYDVVAMKIGRYAMSVEDFLAKNETEIKVRLSGDSWAVEEGGNPIATGLADNSAAVQAAWAHIAERLAVRDEALYELTGLPKEQWKIDGTLIRSTDGRGMFLFSSPRGWSAFSGQACIAESVKIEDALAAIRDCDLLTPSELESLERLFEMTEGVRPFGNDLPHFDGLAARGFAERDADGFYHATSEGLAKLDADPRGLPLNLRNIVFEGAEEIGFEGDARREWNRFMSDRHNGVELLRALENGIELYVGTAGNEPFEVALRGEGRCKDGRYMSDQPIQLLDPSWAGDVMVSEKYAGAVVARQELLRDALRPAVDTASPASPTV